MLKDVHTVLLSTLAEKFHMEIAYAATDYHKVCLTVVDVARPGLQLAGYFDHFVPMRLQIIGNAEASYVNKQSRQDRYRIFDRLFSYKFPALVVSRDIAIDPACLEMAKK